MPDHDHGYKLLFSHPEMVADLLKGFVREPWVAGLDWATLENVNRSFVSDDLRGREDDVIWRVRWHDEWLYVYIVLEFQSTVDPFMAVRLLTYIGLLYQDLIRGKQLTPRGLLPPVLPLVLYNGEGRWTAAQDVADLVEAVPGGLERYRPQLRYLLLEENRYTEEELAPLHNLVAALFRLENSREPADIQRVLTALIAWVRDPEQTPLRRAFTVWLRRVLLPSRLPDVSLPEVQDLVEVKAMLAERVLDWTKEWREKGLEDGRQEGQADLLLEQLGSKFGPLDEDVRARGLGADSETLKRWGKRILTADLLEDVLV